MKHLYMSKHAVMGIDTYYSIAVPCIVPYKSYTLYCKKPDCDDSVLYMIGPNGKPHPLPPLHHMSEDELFQEGLVADYILPFDYVLALANAIMDNYKTMRTTRELVQVNYED